MLAAEQTLRQENLTMRKELEHLRGDVRTQAEVSCGLAGGSYLCCGQKCGSRGPLSVSPVMWESGFAIQHV